MALKLIKSKRIELPEPVIRIEAVDTSKLTVPFTPGTPIKKDRYGWVAEKLLGAGSVCDDQCVYFPEQERDNYNEICVHCRDAHKNSERYIKAI